MADETPTPNDVAAQQQASADGQSAEDVAAQALLSQWVADDAPPDGQQSTSIEGEEALRREVARLRKENASQRVNAKKAAADEARNELAQQIGKALGIVEDETPDPAKLTEQLTRQTSETRQAKLELAVYRAAQAAGVDAAALLDSKSFLSQVEQVDASDAEAVKAAVADAVAGNARFATQPQSRLPQPWSSNAANSGSGKGELSVADVKRLRESGDIDAIVKAQKEGRLKHILGQE